MPRRKCAIADTDASPVRSRKPVRTGARPPVRAKEGSLVEVEMIEGHPQQGVVLSVAGGVWENPWYEILFNDGTRRLLRTKKVRIINRRKRR